MPHPDRHPLDGNMIAADEHYADADCPGCQGGEWLPSDGAEWCCPWCGTQYYETDEEE